MTGLSGLEPASIVGRLKGISIEPAALRKASAALGEVIGALASQVDVGALQAKIATATEEGDLSGLSRRELREGCRAFLMPPNPPGHQPKVGDALIDEVVRLGRRAGFFALIDVYLDRFQAGDEQIARLGKRLGPLMSTWPWRPQDQWPARAKDFHLFSAIEAPARLAASILTSDQPIPAIFEKAGLVTEGRQRGGMAETAFVAACRLTAQKRGPASIPLQNKVLEWAHIGATALAYPRAWPDYANALFSPWAISEPESDHKSTLIDAAVGYAGDPRVREALWRPLRELPAYDVMLRWLTKASVEQFFDIVAEATDRLDMWTDRRRFWTAYLKKDLISAAWVAFGADGAWRAEQAAKQSGDNGLSMFGRLAAGGGRTREHAALIMHIGDLTVVEWSHNGRWNIWRKSDSARPPLFRQNARRWPDYEPHELMYAPISGAHLGNWQWKVRETIRQYTGLQP